MTSEIFHHQEAVYWELLETARVFFEADWQNLPARPRFSRFISGPTGTGKTHMVNALARELVLPVFSITASSWIPFGASQRGARTTWVEIVEFCRSHTKGIIFLDEVDKLMGWSSWMQYIRTEAFSLLDCRVPETVILSGGEYDQEDPEELRTRVEIARSRLAASFFLVGAGAFQALWQAKASTPIGFGAVPSSPPAALGKVEMGAHIPPEIINRFASPILLLPPLRATDYSAILLKVTSQLDDPLKAMVSQIGANTISDAVASGTGCRWIEEVLLRALMELPHRPAVEPVHCADLEVI